MDIVIAFVVQTLASLVSGMLTAVYGPALRDKLSRNEAEKANLAEGSANTESLEEK